MARDTLTGSRIRERRVMLGMKQAELARDAGISGSYLNLIEHNRRRIGGKLLLDIARVLQVEPAVLSQGAEAALLSALRDAAALYPEAGPELERAEEFAGRFPGWARVLKAQAKRQTVLAANVAALNDRLTHEPQLAEALHDMLGAVTAIRSTSAILAETEALEPAWRDRFHRNLNEDARRLAEDSQALVAFLDRSDGRPGGLSTPQDEIDGVLARRGHHFETLEHLAEGGPDAADGESMQAAIAMLLQAPWGESDAAKLSGPATHMLRGLLHGYARDACRVPLSVLCPALARCGAQPLALAEACAAPLDVILRRLAHLRADHLRPALPQIDERGLGLAICDNSGALHYRKQITGLTLPRFGAACPMWVLYQSLSRPVTLLHEDVEQGERYMRSFDCYGYAVPEQPAGLNRAPRLNAHMLVVPTTKERRADIEAPAGCRICGRADCASLQQGHLIPGGS